MTQLTTSADTIVMIRRGEKFAATRDLLEQLEEIKASLQLAPEAIALIDEATTLSLTAHFHQADRPDGHPYINHPLSVAIAAVTKFGIRDPESIIAALLHDTVEDQAERIVTLLGGDLRASLPVNQRALSCIENRFGSRVAALVGALTNPDFDAIAQTLIANGDRREGTDIKNALYKAHFADLYHHDTAAFLIKLADLSQNAFALGNLPEGPKLEKLRRKYGPVLEFVNEVLEHAPASGHPLSALKGAFLCELRATYERDYQY